MLEGYEKLKTVGKGAFGTATLYRRLNDNKHVVMKEIITMNLDNEEKKAALNEVEIISTLKHSNIIRYLGSFQKDDSLIIIMEYADGGNLAQLINIKRDKNDTFTENGILNIIQQTSAAILYMHSSKILHRDLKTANIFMNMNGTVKVGDFGISKMLNTKSQAQTVVGTPYYLSPEMCEGFDYNEKSDIWAMGCILYELAALRKPFDAPTLPVLVKKITACEYEDIPSTYSEDLAILVRSILQKNYASRPTAKYIHDIIIPRILETIPNTSRKKSAGLPTLNSSISKERSVLYEIYDFGDDQQIVPIELPHKRIIDFSASLTHHIVVSADHFVYTWGENNYGQLALGQVDLYRKLPVCVKLLKGANIIRCSAGLGFSMFLSEEGHIYSCGMGATGVLGHNEYSNVLQPTIINSLLSVKILEVVCGNHHVVAVSSDGKVYTWGLSKFGELGQGHIQKRCKPFPIIMLMKVQRIFACEDASMLLTINGQLMASGNNHSKKLGIQNQERLSTFQLVRQSFGTIRQISMGANNTVILNENGVISVLGNNLEFPQIVKLNNVVMSSCGPEFACAVDKENVVWFWGTYKKSINGAMLNSFNSEKTLTKFHSIVSLLQAEDSTERKKLKENVAPENYTVVMIKTPSSILALFASEENLKMGNIIQIANIKAKENSVLLLVHTTIAPSAKKLETQNNNFKSSVYHHTSTVINVPNTPSWS